MRKLFLTLVVLSAEALAVTVNPSQLQFITSQVGTSSAPQTVTIVNDGTATVSGINIGVTGDFSAKTTCRASLKAGASCQANVIFSPTTAGLRSGNLTLSYKGQHGSTVVGLSAQAYTLVSISLAPQPATVPMGAWRQFFALATFSDGSVQDISSSVSWTSSDASKLTVNSQGLATGVASGSAQLTASSMGISGSVTVSVTSAVLMSLAVDAAQLSLPQGYAQQFNAIGSYSDGSQLVLTNQVAWTSSSPAIATVNTGGEVTTLGSGNALITAELGAIRSSTTVTVSDVTLQSMAISPSNISIANHTVIQLQATGTYSDGSTRSLTTLSSWTSSATNVAAVGAGGRMNGGSPGSATIGASFAGLSATTPATVTAAQLTSIAVSPGTRSMPAAVAQRFIATGTFSDGTTQDVSVLVHWMSSSAAAATVVNSTQSKGVANTLAPGSTVITASYLPSVSGAATLTVNNATLVSIAINPANRTVGTGSALAFTATGTFSDQTTQNLTQSVTWASSNRNILFVNNDPGAPGSGYGLAEGQSNVTATIGSLSGSTPFAVAAPNLVSINVTPQSSTLVAGTTQQLTATGTFGDGSTQNLTSVATWSSSSAAATVGDSPGTNGLALGVSAGQATITATSAGVSGSGQLTVTAAQLASIAITPANPTVITGASQQFTAKGTYTDGSSQELTSTVNWTSNPTTTATISQGLAQALSAGQATITAAAGAINASTILTVNSAPAQLTSISISPSSATVFAGSSQQFTATGNYSDGSTQDLTSTVTWSGSPSSVATISNAPGSQGLAQALITGSATITATSGTISSTAQLSVVPLLTSIAISPASASISVGQTEQFTATATYSDGSTGDVTATATWSTDPPAAATIGNAPGNPGLAQAVASGAVTVTATFASISGTANLTIAPVLVSISVTPANPTVVPGANQQFAATGTYSDNSTQDLTSQVTWTAVPTTIATIGTNGMAQALIPGQATITAALGTIANTAALTVSTTPPALVSLAISPLTPATLAGSTIQFHAMGTYSDGSTQDLTALATWTSTTTTVATIASAGLATGNNPGSTTIGASFGAISGANASLTVMATPPPPGLCQPADTGLPPLPSSAPQPSPPQSCTVPVYPAPSGQPILVSTVTALKNALTNAQCGQWIQVQAGVIYQGNFAIPGLACPASNPVLVESSAIRATVRCTPGAPYPCSGSTVGQTVPVFPQWTYASQSLAGTTYVPTLESTNSSASLVVADGAANWYIAGLEVTLAPSATYIYPIVGMGETTTTVAALPQNITFDRVLIHPAPCVADSISAPCKYVSRGLDLNAVNGTVMYSSIWGIVATGQDTQAINVNNTVGPGLILGNYLEATGENLMFNTECTIITQGVGNPPPGSVEGAQGWVPGDIGMTTCPAPSDFTVRLNHFVKQMAWRNNPAGCNPSLYQCYDVKNQSEVKHGQRILYDSNLFDTTFAGGQAEFLIANCWATGIYVCQDLAYTNNVFIHGPQVGAVAGNGVVPAGCGTGAGQLPCIPATGQRFLFRNNLAVDINGIAYGGATCMQSSPYTGCAPGGSFQLQNTNGFVMDHNTIINETSQYQNALNFSDAQPTTDPNLQLTNNFQFGSPFNNGGCPGCAIAGLPSPVTGGQIFVGDYWSYPTMWGLTNKPTYPAGITSLSANATPVSGQPTCQQNNNPMQACWALDWALVGFTDFAGGNAGTDLAGLVLASASPYHNAATDGSDIGANVPAVLSAISSVR